DRRSTVLPCTTLFRSAGEVYFPPRLAEMMDGDPDTAPIVIDALHVIHARSHVSKSARPVNCAAGSARTGRYLSWDPKCAVIYLRSEEQTSELQSRENL